MLSDHEAEEITRARRQGIGGPVVLKWIDQLLADRLERIRQLDHLRKRLSQAFRYLDGLVRDAQRPPASSAQPPACPRCRKPYVRAAGLSPNGTVYFHADRSECRTTAPNR
jgi:hypothetical protein